MTKTSETIKDFVRQFERYLSDNHVICQEFDDAWHNADAQTVTEILIDFMDGMESQS